MKHQTINLVKFKALSKLLGRPQWQVVGLLESLWLFCQHNARDGVVSRFTNLEIGAWLEYDGDADELIGALITTRWLDQDDHGNVAVHDWFEHRPNWLKGIEANGHPKQTKYKPSPKLSSELSLEPSSKPSLEPGSKPGSEPGSEPSLEPPSLTLPNPTQDPPSPSQTQPAEGESEWGWERVTAEVLGEGVVAAKKAITTARDSGATPRDMQNIVQHFRTIKRQLEHPEALLYGRITNWFPGQRPTANWPVKSNSRRYVQAQPPPPQSERDEVASMFNTAITGGMI